MKNYLLCFFILTAGMLVLPRASLYFPAKEQEAEIFLTVLDTESGETSPLPLEDYVIGAMEKLTLPAEKEARKAAAIALRSCALYCRAFRPVHGEADLCNDPSCCGGFSVEHFSEENVSAAAETAGRYLTYQGNPAAARFHQSCGKYTADHQAVYGTAVPYLVRIRNVEEHAVQTLTLGDEDFRTRLGIPKELPLEDLFWEYDRSLYLLRLHWGNISLSGAECASRLSLPSPFLSAVLTEDGVVLTCHGSGDGVGMSLGGASLLAREGNTAWDILAFYFPGTEPNS